MRFDWLITFALICLGIGLFIIIGAVKRWALFYDSEAQEWRIMRLPFYSKFKVFKDLDDSYFVAYHILIGSGFLLGFLYIIIRLLITH